jgi:glycosyltransferase involved in cell wall biosynthesis
MASPAEVDILLPVFNGAATIAEALDSLRRQTLTAFRIIVIDDGSSDRTPSILAEMARDDDRITVISRQNGGIVAALNAGLAHCRGVFIARQDADDISDPSRLALQLAYLQAHPDCVAVSGAVRHIGESGAPLESTQYFPSPEPADAHWAPSREPYLCHPFLMARRDALQAIGGYRYVHHSEDTDLYWRLAERGRLHNLDTPLGSYRLHGASISGGSIVNGRIMALSSQLAGLSALRRRIGRPDLSFTAERLADYQRSPAAADIYALGRQGLDEAEARYLRIAMAAKLLELTSYRPFELDLADCLFVRQAWPDRAILSAANRSELDRVCAAATARLLGKGLLREAAALSQASLYASVAARMAAAVLPSSWRRTVAGLWARARQATCP